MDVGQEGVGSPGVQFCHCPAVRLTQVPEPGRPSVFPSLGVRWARAGSAVSSQQPCEESEGNRHGEHLTLCTAWRLGHVPHSLSCYEGSIFSSLKSRGANGQLSDGGVQVGLDRKASAWVPPPKVLFQEVWGKAPLREAGVCSGLAPARRPVTPTCRHRRAQSWGGPQFCRNACRLAKGREMLSCGFLPWGVLRGAADSGVSPV